MTTRARVATRLMLREQARRPLLLVLLVGLPFFFITRAIAHTEATPRRIGLPGGTEFLTDMNGTVVNPDWVGTFDATYRFNNVTLRYGLDWIDGDRDRTYEFFAYDELTGVSDPELVQLYRDNYYLEAANYFLHSASVQFNIAEKYELTVGVQNLFDTQPPRISAVGYTTIGNAPLYSGYDYRGRTFFANASFQF